MISAKIIADSLSRGQRLTTFELSFPRIVLAEFNTHRMLSKNSASSRAIPYRKMVEQVMTNPFIPIAWQKDHKGMQGTEYMNESEAQMATAFWLEARDKAVDSTCDLTSPIHFESGSIVTKQLVNRLLEPFMYHKVLVTGSHWGNFFALRAAPDAEIHIARLAHLMLEAYNESQPISLLPNEWHIPFIGDDLFVSRISNIYPDKDPVDTILKIATARCARLSYQTLGDEPKIDYAADLKLYDSLLKSGHMSPFEHCAKAMTDWEWDHSVSVQYAGKHESGTDKYIFENGWSGNFRGFIQLRKMMANENRTDSRVIPKP